MPEIVLEPTADILVELGRDASDRDQVLVGFAAETDDLVEHAADKLAAKRVDLIVGNDVGAGRLRLRGRHQPGASCSTPTAPSRSSRC